jgi:chromosome segregation ATPase
MPPFTSEEGAPAMPTYQEIVDKYNNDLKKMSGDIKKLNNELEVDRIAIVHLEQQIEFLQKTLPRFEKEKNKDKIKSTKSTIAKHEKDIKTRTEGKRKRKTNIEVLQKKHEQMSAQVARFKLEQRNRPKHETVPAAVMEEWEKMYFPLLKKLDLGLGDTVKKMDKMIAAREKKLAALQAETNKLQDEIDELLKKNVDPGSKDVSKRIARAAKIPGERIIAEDEVKILKARRDEYKAGKQKLKQQLTDQTITKDKYLRAKARLQAVLKFEEVR